MANVASNQIYVYPTTTRASDIKDSKDLNTNANAYGRLNLEYNLVTTLTRLTDKKSFVISNDDGYDVGSYPGDYPYINSNYINFIIGGYAVSVDKNAVVALLPPSGTGGVYAAINLDFGSSLQEGDKMFMKIDGGDADSKYVGITFLSNSSADAYTYTLKILEGNKSAYSIPRESLIRFTENSVYIDDGDLSS